MFVAHVWTYRSWWLPMGAVLLGGVLLLLLRRRHHTTTGHTVATWMVTRIGVVSAGIVLVVAATVSTPWVPLERVTTHKGTIYGYVLSPHQVF